MEARGMGFFDSFKGAGKKTDTAASGAAPGGGGVIASAEEESAVSSLLGATGGKLPGLLDRLGSLGLEDRVQSWVGKGANLPVSGDKIKSVLESDQVSSVAAKLGISSDEAAAKIADVLPTIIDKLTPDGVVPDPQALATKLTGLIKK
jgi:uncharacterized protein YidB (DUF937 family)